MQQMFPAKTVSAVAITFSQEIHIFLFFPQK
jgi:hypothetical protein